MRVLVACEFSGVVRNAFLRKGHEAYSCDILDASDEGPHIKGDVLEVLGDGWDLMVAHPPCTYLCSSGLHWNKRRPGRAKETAKALKFIESLWLAPIEKVAIENPRGCINTSLNFMPKPQTIQPYQFGEDASKTTCIWSRGLPLLRPTRRVEGRWVVHNGNYVERWSNQTESGQNKLGPSENRWADRSKTYSGIAQAMAEQWG